jgi:hypothetical protein
MKRFWLPASGTGILMLLSIKLYNKSFWMSSLLKKTGVAAFFALAAITSHAQSDSVNIVSTAVPFLRISPDPRSGGMGDMGIATSADANSVFWNLAKIPTAKKRSAIALNYTPWLKDLGLTDVYLASAAFYHQMDEQSAISSSLRYFSLGNIQLTDYSGNVLNSVKPSEFCIDMGYSRILNQKLSIGLALRYINSRLVTGDVGTGVVYKAGNAVAGDASLYYKGTNDAGEGLTWGLAFSNLGSKIGYTNDSRNKDFIPANMGLGGTYTVGINESNRITFGLDFNKLLVPAPPVATGDYATDSANMANYHSTGVISSYFKSFADGLFSSASIGTEYNYNDQFFVRAGYFYESKQKGNRQFFSMGAGFSMDMLSINFSYLVPSGSGVTRNPLSNTLRFGIIFNLGQKE